MRRRTTVTIAGLIVVSAASVAVASVATAGRPAAEEDDPVATDLETVSAEQRDLVRSEELDGLVGHGDQRPLSLAGQGTLTGLPDIGAVIEFGHPVLEVDGEPVVLLPGSRPAWRAIGPNTGKGEDVRQLEAALVILGYADPDVVTIDDTWTSATTAAVKALQKLLGMPDDGRLDLGEVVFSEEIVRIAAVGGELGDPASAAGIEVTGLQQSVDVSLTPSKLDLVAVGDSVDVELPSEEVVTGTVTEIGQPEVGTDGSVTFPVTIDAGDLDVSDGVPVTVTVDVVAVEGATAVPAEALLALAEGGYAVEIPDSSTATGTRLVPVEIGAFADGWVEIDGEIAPGDEVVVP